MSSLSFLTCKMTWQGRGGGQEGGVAVRFSLAQWTTVGPIVSLCSPLKGQRSRATEHLFTFIKTFHLTLQQQDFFSGLAQLFTGTRSDGLNSMTPQLSTEWKLSPSAFLPNTNPLLQAGWSPRHPTPKPPAHTYSNYYIPGPDSGI